MATPISDDDRPDRDDNGTPETTPANASPTDTPDVDEPTPDDTPTQPDTSADAEPTEPPLGLDARPALEAVLLAADEPLTSRRLAQLVDLPDGTHVRRLAREINQRYELQGRAFAVEEIAGGFQMLTRPEFARYLRRLHQSDAAARLSKPALETLAIVAYRQPVLRADVEAIRGVESGEMLRQLMEKGMVRIAGRAEALGRPFLYATTRRFLQRFGLKGLKELPMVEELRVPIGASLGGATSGAPDAAADTPAAQDTPPDPSAQSADQPDGRDDAPDVSLHEPTDGTEPCDGDITS